MIATRHEQYVTPPLPDRGPQIRRAITALLRAFDDGDHARGGAEAAMLYDAALMVVMRLIYLPKFCANG